MLEMRLMNKASYLGAPWGSSSRAALVTSSLRPYAGLFLPWRWLAVAGEIPVLLMIILMCPMPESPRFLISKGKEDEAVVALKWLRGDDTDYWWEFERIRDSVMEQVRHLGLGTWRSGPLSESGRMAPS